MSRLRRYRWVLIALALLLLALGSGWLGSYLAWRRALRAAGFVEEMEAPERGERVLVVAPHPDDEALGAAGLIRQALREGAQVDVVLMTNGDGSELALIFGERELRLRPEGFIALGRTRQRETLEAMQSLGLEATRVHFLGFPNNGLLPMWQPQHWRYSTPYESPHTKRSFSPYQDIFTPEAPYCGQQVLSDLTAIMQQVRPTAIFVTAPQDLHPDHWATCAFVRYAVAKAAARGAEWATRVKIYGYLVHWPNYPSPQRLDTRRALLPPAEMVGRGIEWERLSLSPQDARAKLRVIRTYRSQQPGLGRLLLRFARANEAFQRLPAARLDPGGERGWRYPGRAHRRLGGAQVMELRLRAPTPNTLSATLVTPARAMGRDAYVALDLRGWDERANPLIATVYLSGAAPARAEVLTPDGLQHHPVTVREPEPGRFEVSFLPLAEKLLRQEEMFVTCWGSVRDRATAAVVAAPVRVPPAQR